MHIGERIKLKREQLGLTQQELAAKLGYTNRATIAKIESGKNDIVQSKVVAFAEALDTTPAYLMGWEDEENTKQPYYLDPETAAIAQDLKDNPGHRVLFDASRKLSPEAMEEVKNFIKFQIAKEEPWRDE